VEREINGNSFSGKTLWEKIRGMVPNRLSQTSKLLVNIHLSRQHTITFIVIFE